MKNLKHSFILLISLSFFLIACAPPTETPKVVADKYWQYIQAGNIKEAGKLTTENNPNILQQHANRANKNTKISTGTAVTIISTTITTIDPATKNSAAENLNNNYSHVETFNTVLVFQQGQWKIDLNNSPIPPVPNAKEKNMQQLSEALSESMQKNIKSIDQAVSHGMYMLNEALRDSSKEMGNTLLDLMNELNGSMKKSIEKMQKNREQKMQNPGEANKPSPPQETQPGPRKGEGMI